MPRAGGELAEIQGLRAAIALAERVDVVDVAEDFRAAPGEGLGRQAAQIVPSDDAAMDVGHAGRDVAAELEPAAALGDFDGPDLPRPVVDVLEQVAMDGAKVVEVEVAFGNAFGDSIRD